MMKTSKVIFICMSFFVFQTAEAFSLEYAKNCSKPNQVENLNMQKMLGRWYIIKENYASVGTSCSILEFKEKFNRFWIEGCTTEYNGTFGCYEFANLTSSDFRYQISADVNRKLLFDEHGDDFNFHIIATDYKTYAGIYICRDNRFGFSLSTQSVMILSRTDVLDQRYIKKITSKFIEFKIPTEYLWTNDQDKCPAAQIILTSATESNTISFDIYLISLLIIMMLK